MKKISVMFLGIVAVCAQGTPSWPSPLGELKTLAVGQETVSAIPAPPAESSCADFIKEGSIEDDSGLPVVRLNGAPYALGCQHGFLLKDKIRENYAHIAAVLKQVDPRAQEALDAVWSRLEPHTPQAYLDEMRGLAEGAGVSLQDVHRVHAIPDAFSTQCSVGAFFGRATGDGRLYALRNLDWAREFGAQKYAVLFAVSPAGKHRFVSAGFAGLIGVLSGVNEAGLSDGEVGSRSNDETHDGTSFVFLLRRILEEADTVSSAAGIVGGAQRTVGINYLVAGAREKKALAFETTAHRFAAFADADPAEARSPYGMPFAGAVFRADLAFDPAVRAVQTADGGNPDDPAKADPHGSESYDVRYRGQGNMVKTEYGRIGVKELMALAKDIAPADNIQTVIFAFPEMWVSYARDGAVAAKGPFHRFDVPSLLR